MRKNTALKLIIFLVLLVLSVSLFACKKDDGEEEAEIEQFEILIEQSQDGILEFGVESAGELINSGDSVEEGSVLSFRWQLDEGYDAVLYVNEEATGLISGDTLQVEGATSIELVTELRHYIINYSVQAEGFKLFFKDEQLSSGDLVPHGALLKAQWTENNNYEYSVSVPKGRALVFTQNDCQFEIVENTELFIFARRLYNIKISTQAGVIATIKSDDKTISDEGRLFECNANLFYELESGYLLQILLNGVELDLKSGDEIEIDEDILIEFVTKRVYSIKFEIEESLLQYLVMTDQEGNAISPPFNAGQSVKIRWNTDLYRSEFEFSPDKFVDYGQFFLLESIADDYIVSVSATRQHKLTITNTYDCVSILGEQRQSGEILYFDEGSTIDVVINSQLLASVLLNYEPIEIEFDGQKSFFEFDLYNDTDLSITLLCLVSIEVAQGFSGISVVSGDLAISDGDYLPLGEFLMIDFTPLDEYYLYVDLVLQNEIVVLRQLEKNILIEVRHEVAPQVTVEVGIDFDSHYLDWFEIRVLDNNELVFRHEVDRAGNVMAELPFGLELIFVFSYTGSLLTCDGTGLEGGFFAEEGQQFEIVSGYLIELVGSLNNIKCFVGQDILQVISGYYYPVNSEIFIIYDRYDYAKLFINGQLQLTAIMDRFEYSFILVGDTEVILQLI